MKKAMKFLTLLLAFALAVAFTTVIAYAADCVGESTNVALNSTVTGDRGPGTVIDVAEDGLGQPFNSNYGPYVFWGVWDQYGSAVDGNPNTVCPTDTVNSSNVAYGLRITFDGPYALSKVVIQPYGQGRVESSHSIAGAINGRQNGYDMNIYFYDGSGNEIDMIVRYAGKENIEIDMRDYEEKVCQIYIYIPIQSNKLAQGVWEVEAWTTETHNWELQSITTNPSCTAQGVGTVKCSGCGETDNVIVKPTGHKDNCTGTCAYGCGLSIDVSHSKDSSKPCSDACGKCGLAGAVNTSASHTADASNPCSNICVVCGENKVPDAYTLTKANNTISGTIYSTSTVPPYTYAKHVANPNDPCDTSCNNPDCAKYGVDGVVAAAHMPGAKTGTWAQQQGVTINPCSSRQCAECGMEDAFPIKPHVRFTDPNGTYVESKNKTYYPCTRVCAECYYEWESWYSHEMVDADGSPDCGGKCKYCNKAYIKEHEHSFTPASPTTCVDCGYSTLPCAHSYANACDNRCDLCGSTRYGWRSGGYPDDYWHVYTNTCDTTCNDCNAERTIQHTYPTAACAEFCTVCGFRRDTTTPHTYSDVLDDENNPIENSVACDAYCDVCSEERQITHNYLALCSKQCNVCNAPNPNIVHTYTNDCDSDCNIIGCLGTRKAPHNYAAICSEKCKDCDAENEDPADHIFGTGCNATCTRGCGAVKAGAAHKYDNACDATCNVCSAERVVAGHAYDNDCDITCNICSAERTVADHVYDHGCDAVCNVCSATRTSITHAYSEWTENDEGNNERVCLNCGNKETKEKDGLGGGAIAGIAAGSTVLLGGGGFAGYWFIFRKKRI